MQDRTTIDTSDAFREFIAALVEEVVLEGKPFDDKKKKYLQRYSQEEGMDYAALEKNLTDFFEVMEEWKRLKSKSSERLAKLIANDCYLSKEEVEKLLDGSARSPIATPSPITEFIEPSRLIRDGKIKETEENGRIIIPCEWKFANGFHEGLARVKNEEDLNGYVDPMGNIIIPFQWRIADNFSDGLAFVSNGKGENFFIDKSGNVVIACEPDVDFTLFSSDFHEGLALVRKNLKYGFMDKSGNIVIPCTWKGASSFREGMASVQDDQGKYGCIDTKGRLVIPCQYEDDISFHEGLATIYNDGESFVIDKTGRKVFDLECGCDHVWFQEGLGSVEDNNGFIDKNGKYVIEGFCSPEKMGFAEGLAPTDEGYIDHSGRIVIPDDHWEECLEFSEGLAVVVKNHKCGYIDHCGRLVIPYIWDSAASFSEGLAKVRLADKYFFINKQGKVLCKVKDI